MKASAINLLQNISDCHIMCNHKNCDFSHEKDIMGHRKIFKIIIALFVALGIFVNSSFATVCLCGQACSHFPLKKNNIKFSLLFHLQCSGTQCKSCHLEKGKTLKAANVLTKEHNAKNTDSTLVPITQTKNPSSFHTSEEFSPFYVMENFSGFPLYLQNLCLRF